MIRDSKRLCHLQGLAGLYQSSAEVSCCPVSACPPAYLIPSLIQQAKADISAETEQICSTEEDTSL